MAADPDPKIFELYRSLSYPSVGKFYAVLRQQGYVLTKADVEEFVRGVGSRQVFVPRRTAAQKSGNIVAPSLDSRWFADLIDNTAMAAPGGQKYALVLQDVFSRKAYARALRDKKPDTVNKAVADVLREHGKAPQSIETDQGPEFARLGALGERLGFLWADKDPEDVNARATVDRAISAIRQALSRRMTQEGTDDWAALLKAVVEGYKDPARAPWGGGGDRAERRREE